jgi:hypothetical protein
MWTLPSATRGRIAEALRSKVEFLMRKLNVFDTAEMIAEKIRLDVDAVRKSTLELSGAAVAKSQAGSSFAD